jgi:predicted ATP-grasp superfamily ATP-dependent carboligase
VHVLIVGVSTRAAADSAARAGFDVTALDAYADIDQHESVHALSLPRDFATSYSPEAIVAAARELPGEAVVYLSSFENHAKEVDALAAGRVLWGNPSDVLRRVRDPAMLVDALARHGIRAPRVLPSDREQTPPASGIDRWLSKPRSSGGGHGVTSWRPGQTVPRGHYLQERVEGIPGSVVFVAAAGRGVALAATRQLVGESAFGVSGFRYCGSILPPAIGDDAAAAAIALVDAVTSAFPLVGVGSIDVIATAGELRPVEVNPRWSASMELVDAAHRISMFRIHADACATGMLPDWDLRRHATTTGYGKAVVFARHDVVVGDTGRWLEDSTVRDIPRTGEQIAKGQPVCTVLATGADEATCYAKLVERAERIYAELYTRTRLE